MSHPEVPTTDPGSPRSVLGEVSECGCLSSMITDIKQSHGRDVVLEVKSETVYCEEHGEDLKAQECTHTLVYRCPHDPNVAAGKLIMTFVVGVIVGALVIAMVF